MFRKVIVFGLFKMIKKKKVTTASLGPGLTSGSSRVGSGTAALVVTYLVV